VELWSEAGKWFGFLKNNVGWSGFVISPFRSHSASVGHLESPTIKHFLSPRLFFRGQSTQVTQLSNSWIRTQKWFGFALFQKTTCAPEFSSPNHGSSFVGAPHCTLLLQTCCRLPFLSKLLMISQLARLAHSPSRRLCPAAAARC
jgi:hypothetical protein